MQMCEKLYKDDEGNRELKGAGEREKVEEQGEREEEQQQCER